MKTVPQRRHNLRLYTHESLSPISGVLVFSCYYNKLLQFRGLNNTDVLSYHSVGHKFDMGFTRLKSRYQHCSTPFWNFQGSLFFFDFASFWRALTFLDLWRLLYLQSQQWQVKFFSHWITQTLFSLHFQPSRTPGNQIGSIWIFQVN